MPPSGLQCLKASTDGMKYPSWDFILKKGHYHQKLLYQGKFHEVGFDIKINADTSAATDLLCTHTVYMYKQSQ